MSRLARLGLLAGVLSCASAGESGPVELRVGTDPAAPDFGAVEVRGLPPSLGTVLARVSPQDPRWSEVLAVRAVSGEGGVPPVAGSYRIDPGGRLRFAPRFRPEGPLVYHVRLDPAALARLADRTPTRDSAREWRFELPGSAEPAPATVVSAIHPSTPVVPANQLRWYVEFSAPMREGEAAERVRLLDSGGREVGGAFLVLEQELWDPSRRRLTLLFDMGRVKRGIRTRLEAGPVLEAGQWYTLRIDAGWRDARGAPLVRGMEHRFRAGPEDHAPVDPARWSVHPPAIGSQEALQVDFGESLDHALAERLIVVEGPDGAPLSGENTLRPDGRRWRFTPAVPWYAGSYRLRVHPALEDLAGNRLGHAFDADLSAGEKAGVEPTGWTLDFMPQGEVARR